jgi:hypothetical protein
MYHIQSERLLRCTERKSSGFEIFRALLPDSQILRHWTNPRISGNFEVRLRDGTVIGGSFAAKERKVKYPQRPICE